ncbi:hypothetical protein A1O3_01458 [Capronia epimyces CBS 606.96]|uniref:Uncharacterized protein n=1 Tax=Capronia epimyces CBS 606.96 TaxID=1182542 RepID=W9YK43_9EURO|nr:uncharacterized protein A1O3_01458 [Capronia epimyces CBS 606.96]EXJ92903.1 hypothetical protein A1O3_01458 [Capronia epimyces CBS 606.96]
MVVGPKSAKSQAQEADVAANEALLLHAEAAKLAKSWLSGAFGGGGDDNHNDDNKADEDDALQKEQELFGPTAVPHSEKWVTSPSDSIIPDGGVGFQETPATNATTSSRNSDQTTAFLRKQLLRGHNNSHVTAKPRPRPGPQALSSKRIDSEDEEEGRSGLGKVRSKGKGQTASSSVNDESVHPMSETATPAADGTTSPALTVASPIPSRTAKKRGSSYLDEVLASRAAKKKKKIAKHP